MIHVDDGTAKVLVVTEPVIGRGFQIITYPDKSSLMKELIIQAHPQDLENALHAREEAEKRDQEMEAKILNGEWEAE
jgi:hypothetical protein